MTEGIYSKEVMKHFTHPKNMGEIKNPDGVGEVGNVICGDVMKVYIKVKDNKINDIKFQTYGCAAAIATSSMITEIAKGKPPEDAMKTQYKDIIDELGGLPPLKVHCSKLAIEALHAAINDYYKKVKK